MSFIIRDLAQVKKKLFPSNSTWELLLMGRLAVIPCAVTGSSKVDAELVVTMIKKLGHLAIYRFI